MAEPARPESKEKPSRFITHRFEDDNRAVADVLSALAAGFAREQVTLAAGAESIRFQPTELVAVEIRARQKGGKEKISIKLSWTETGPRAGGRSRRTAEGDDEKDL